MAQPSADNTFSIVMVGPQRTGKTSMLTAMYERFDTAAAGSNLVFEPSGLTKGKMSNFVAELMAISKSPDLVSDQSPVGIHATGVEHRFEFTIRLKDDPEDTPRCRLVWRDFPGAWLGATGAASAQTSYRDALAASMFSMVTIDAPFLMEADGRYHQARNKPSLVQGIYEAALANVTDRNRIVMLAPVRCEKYRTSTEAARQLANRVKAEYSSLIQFLEQKSALVVITPIETVGCLQFSHFKAANNDPLLPVCPAFVNTGSGYAPKDADQPLRYVLWHISNMLDEQVNPPGGLWAWIREWLALSDPRFRAASAHLTKGLKGSDDGFEIVWTAAGKGKS